MKTTPLKAINKSTISTYGHRSLTIDIGLRRRFQWLFWVTDVSYAIIGADFLRHFGLLVDMANKRLHDKSTSLMVAGIVSGIPPLSQALIPPPGIPYFVDILAAYPPVDSCS